MQLLLYRRVLLTKPYNKRCGYPLIMVAQIWHFIASCRPAHLYRLLQHRYRLLQHQWRHLLRQALRLRQVLQLPRLQRSQLNTAMEYQPAQQLGSQWDACLQAPSLPLSFFGCVGAERDQQNQNIPNRKLMHQHRKRRGSRRGVRHWSTGAIQRQACWAYFHSR